MMRVVVVVVVVLAVCLRVGAETTDRSNILLYSGRNNPSITADGMGPTNIIGRDGLCVDVSDGFYINGDPIILWPCGNGKRNQLWTFPSDGTVRSNGKCMTTHGYDIGSSIMIYDCDKAAADATKWKLVNAGTLVNSRSGLVMTAESGTERTTLTLAQDNNSSSQAWTAVNYTLPVVNYIFSGYRQMCLQANCVENTRLCLAACVMGSEPRQQWALYGDKTIRPYSDRSLCATSNGNSILAFIVVLPCRGTPSQRWTVMPDGAILNPKAALVMDDWTSYPSLYVIVLYKPTGNPSQKWSVI